MQSLVNLYNDFAELREKEYDAIVDFLTSVISRSDNPLSSR